jgi:hypothetical protein
VAEPIVVHAPLDWRVLENRDVARRRKPYETICGVFAKLPSRVRVREDEQGPYLVAGPHERYFGWCADCARATTAGLAPVASE